MFSIKPRLSGENSIIMSLAAAALVVGIYQAKIGPAADAHATGANDSNLLAAVKKAGWESVVLVAGVALLAQDPNIVVMGGAAVIAEELTYRHAIMASPENGQVAVTPQDYLPAGGPPADTTGGQGGGYVSGILEAQAG